MNIEKRKDMQNDLTYQSIFGDDNTEETSLHENTAEWNDVPEEGTFAAIHKQLSSMLHKMNNEDTSPVAMYPKTVPSANNEYNDMAPQKIEDNTYKNLFESVDVSKDTNTLASTDITGLDQKLDELTTSVNQVTKLYQSSFKELLNKVEYLSKSIDATNAQLSQMKYEQTAHFIDLHNTISSQIKNEANNIETPPQQIQKPQNWQQAIENLLLQEDLHNHRPLDSSAAKKILNNSIMYNKSNY